MLSVQHVLHPKQDLETGGSEVQGHPHRESEACLGYLRPSLKTQSRRSKRMYAMHWGRDKAEQAGPWD